MITGTVELSAYDHVLKKGGRNLPLRVRELLINSKNGDCEVQNFTREVGDFLVSGGQTRSEGITPEILSELLLHLPKTGSEKPIVQVSELNGQDERIGFPYGADFAMVASPHAENFQYQGSIDPLAIRLLGQFGYGVRDDGKFSSPTWLDISNRVNEAPYLIAMVWGIEKAYGRLDKFREIDRSLRGIGHTIDLMVGDSRENHHRIDINASKRQISEHQGSTMRVGYGDPRDIAIRYSARICTQEPKLVRPLMDFGFR